MWTCRKGIEEEVGLVSWGSRLQPGLWMEGKQFRDQDATTASCTQRHGKDVHYSLVAEKRCADIFAQKSDTAL